MLSGQRPVLRIMLDGTFFRCKRVLTGLPYFDIFVQGNAGQSLKRVFPPPTISTISAHGKITSGKNHTQEDRIQEIPRNKILNKIQVTESDYSRNPLMSLIRERMMLQSKQTTPGSLSITSFISRSISPAEAVTA